MRLSLTKRGEYAVRLVLQLATAGGRVTATDLGLVCDIPPGNVPTIVNILSRAGILSCSPGRGGGCALGRPAADITMLEVIEAIEGPLASRCVLDSGLCGMKDQECALHSAWSKGRDAVISTLRATSVADAAARERRIVERAEAG
ncbi:MAG TPA: Rrf2 family transcriptional regulator [Acidimicrobiia bacterium]|nr:Rrf2 family transcriptional regulator [Acidimicrobiia bacterium]